MKKIIALFLSTLLLTASATCFAAENTSDSLPAKDQSALAEAEQYAYLDLNSATPAMQEKILEARNTIIFSKDWVADGHEAYVGDVTTGEVLEVLPTFSDLFPGWDLPVEETLLATAEF